MNNFVTVLPNKENGFLYVNKKGEFHFTVKKDTKFASIISDLDKVANCLINEIQAGTDIYGAKIITIESLTPVSDDPLDFLKMIDGKVCIKEGKPIYTYNSVSFKADETDIIV